MNDIIDDLQALLKTELQLYDGVDNSKTADRIGRFTVGLFALENSCHNAMTAMNMINRHKLTVVSLSWCFYGKNKNAASSRRYDAGLTRLGDLYEALLKLK